MQKIVSSLSPLGITFLREMVFTGQTAGWKIKASKVQKDDDHSSALKQVIVCLNKTLAWRPQEPESFYVGTNQT